MATFQTKLAVLITLLVIYWFIITPVIIYFIFKFIQKSQDMVVIKRKPHLTLYLSIVSLIAIAILYPMYLYFAMDFQHIITDHISTYGIPILYGICTFSFIYIIVLRYWIIFYDVKWSQASNDAQWKKFIDENEEKCWFLTHKSTFGNITYCSKIVTVPWLLTCITIIFVDITNDANLLWSICNFSAIFLPIAFVTILWNKTPKIEDEFRIIKEARYFCYVAVTAILLYLLVGFSPALGATPFTRYILGNIVGVINFTGATLWYLCHPLYIARVHQHEQHMNALQSVHMRKPRLPDAVDSNNSYDSILKNILSKEVTFVAFMEHLRNEWSMELLLSFIEFSQYKHILQQMFSNEIDQDIMDKYWKFEHRQQVIIKNPCIPFSSIVHSGLKKVGKPLDIAIRIQSKSNSSADGNDLEISSTITNLSSEDNPNNVRSPSTPDIEKSHSSYNQKIYKDYHEKAWKLCERYIANGGELQINLPDQGRTSIMKLINNYFYNNEQMNMNELFCLFDDAMDELWKLMSYSFCRFILTEKFKTLNLE